tara:strand:+ start:622 stop:792 length:171 start_codon:yes stop_codon:yes gene_type:complete
MNNAKLSLADFKANADKVETIQVLEKVQGGADAHCHWPKEKSLDDAVQKEIKGAGF